MASFGTIAVAMSGGVDSSVVALLLQQQGYHVVGVFMKNWEDATDASYRLHQTTQITGCNWEQDAADARAVCDQLGIDFYVFDLVQEYRSLVFDAFLKELKQGRTPNPDIWCNQYIKFDCFLRKALQLPDVTHVATGHYARTDGTSLYRPLDRSKDQTYFLYRIDSQALEHVLFPLADFTKAQVREMAVSAGLPTARKKDSTGICFIGDIDYRQFVSHYLPMQPGPIETLEGQVLGQHHGLQLYTIGQRTGLGIGGNGPYYVVAKDRVRNVLFVSNQAQDPRLYRQYCLINDLHWLQTPVFPVTCQAQIRYQQTPQTVTVSQAADPDQLRLDFEIPQRAIATGQSAVLYQADLVYGGGIIFD